MAPVVRMKLAGGRRIRMVRHVPVDLPQCWALTGSAACFLAAFFADLPLLRRTAASERADAGVPEPAGVSAERNPAAAFNTASASAIPPSASPARRDPRDRRARRIAPVLVLAGGALAAALLAWRAGQAAALTLPLSDYFDAFALLAALLAATWGYFQWTNHLRGLGVFLLPMIAGLELFGLALSLAGYKFFNAANPWIAVHIASVLLGSACFAAGCVGGAVYLLADRQLRRGQFGERGFLRLPPLASLEKFNQHAILLGFALLTLAVITGLLLQMASAHTLGPDWFLTPKVILTTLTWLIYAPLLHVRLAPAFRGQRAAWLSIIGFLLLIGVFISVNFMPAH